VPVIEINLQSVVPDGMRGLGAELGLNMGSAGELDNGGAPCGFSFLSRSSFFRFSSFFPRSSLHIAQGQFSGDTRSRNGWHGHRTK